MTEVARIPDSTGSTPVPGTKKKMVRASNSFLYEEVKVLRHILRALMRGGDPSVVRNNPAFLSLVRKTIAMAKKVGLG